METPDLQHALELIEQGRPDEAVPLLDTLAAEMPTYAAAFAMLARAHEAAGNWEAAREAWHRARFVMPNSPAIADGLHRVETTTAPTLDLDDEPDALRMDLDLLTEFDAVLDETLGQAFNPFTQPQQPAGADDAATMPAEDAQIGQDYQALGPTEAEDDEPAADDLPYEPPSESPFEAPADTPFQPREDPEETAAPAQAAAPDDPEDDFTNNPAGIYDEIERLIAEKEQGPPTIEDIQEETVRNALAREAEAAEAPAPPADDPAPGDDLDRLIEELESARIVPDPDLDDEPATPPEDEIEDIVSETLARIYAAQGQHEEAARVYDELARQHPDQADYFLDQAARLRDPDRDDLADEDPDEAA